MIAPDRTAHRTPCRTPRRIGRIPALPLTVAAALALTGCQDDPAPTRIDGDAQGQVVEGSISDAMLPLDSVRSTAPPMESATDAAEAPGAAGSGDASEGTGGSPGDAATTAPDTAPLPPTPAPDSPSEPSPGQG